MFLEKRIKALENEVSDLKKAVNEKTASCSNSKGVADNLNSLIQNAILRFNSDPKNS